MKDICKKSHNMSITGRTGWDKCLACYKLRHPKPHGGHRRLIQICPAGHDKNIVGRTASNRCKECRRLDPRSQRDKDRLIERLATDPLFKMAHNLRGRLRPALKVKKWHKDCQFKDYIGCTLEELKAHLEKQFTVGMDWDSYGEKGWHIDHIIPLASATTVEEMIKLCHYTNLQPLWWDANLRKGDSLPTSLRS